MHKGIKLSLYINYFVFAILLNSVSIVMLKSQNVYGVSKTEASLLEFFKDIPIAIVSFIVASFLPRIGFKKAMLAANGLVAIACMSMYFGNSFWSAKVLFACVGVAFALIKVSVYSVIGLVTEGEKEHNSLMSSIEGVFMFGIALAYFLFPAFNEDGNQDAWLRVYWLLAGLALFAFAFLFNAKFDEGHEIPGSNFKEDAAQMFSLMTKLLVVVFVIAAFLFVMVEQGIMTWLPTFNKNVINFSDTLAKEAKENISIILAVILPIASGIGRLASGFLSRFFHWMLILIVCIGVAMALVIFALPLVFETQQREVFAFGDVPYTFYIFPLIGLFLAPIYPLLNSVVLSAIPKRLHSPMTGLIVIFSALGGTLGSRLVGWLFDVVGARTVFNYTLIPMAMLLLSFFILNKLTRTAVSAKP